MKNAPRLESHPVFLIVRNLWLQAFFAIAAWTTIACSSHTTLAQNAIADLRAAGHPVDTAGLAKFYAQRTDASQADQWLAVFETLASREFSQAAADLPFFSAANNTAPSAGAPWPYQERAGQFLKQYDSLRHDLYRLASEQVFAQASPVAFPVEWQMFGLDLSRVESQRRVVQLTRLQAAMALRNRDAYAAMTAAISSLGCGLALRAEPGMVSQLVANLLADSSLEIICRALAANLLSEQQLEQILPVLLQIESTLDTRWRDTLSGERAIGLGVFASPDAAVILGSPSGEYDKQADRTLYLTSLSKLIELDIDSDAEFRNGARAVKTSILGKQGSAAVGAQQYPLSRMFVPALCDSAPSFGQHACTIQLACVAIAIRLHCLQHGSAPKQISQLGDWRGKDQIAVNRFQYRVDNETATIWCPNLLALKQTSDDPVSVPTPKRLSETLWGQIPMRWDIPIAPVVAE